MFASLLQGSFIASIVFLQALIPPLKSQLPQTITVS
ncbi:hypothetical protein Ahy_A05g024623 isoform E [Arachis hypogaea]|uniref:Uncharacterized protein n=1 Tax=Arachis hypogaea TaxID=3818 RepID=A0A445D660_ARAHY|nr:hypothetical protein Ahy_A05g024623 isoform E [Arachis hypogaea]